MTMRWTSVATLVALASCGGRPAAEGPPADAPATVQPTTEWTSEGLDEQPRMRALRERAPAAMDFEPGTTSWRPMQPPPAGELLHGVAGQSVGEAALSLVGKVGWARPLGEDLWELAIRASARDDTAVAVVLLWGLQDDAVAGHDLRIHFVQRGDVWQAERVEERFHCRRRVADGGLCA